MLLVDVPSPAGFDAAPPPRTFPGPGKAARPDTPSPSQYARAARMLASPQPASERPQNTQRTWCGAHRCSEQRRLPERRRSCCARTAERKSCIHQRRILQRRRIPRPRRFLRCCASRPFCGCPSLSMRTPVLAAVAAAVAVPRLRPLPPNCAPPPDGIVPAPPDTPPSSEERTPRTRPPTFGNPGPGPRQKST